MDNRKKIDSWLDMFTPSELKKLCESINASLKKGNTEHKEDVIRASKREMETDSEQITVK